VAAARRPARLPAIRRPSPARTDSTERSEAAMHDALTRYLYLASVRDTDWVAAHFGHR